MNPRTSLFQVTMIQIEYILHASCGRIFTLYNNKHSWNDTNAVCMRHGQQMLLLKTAKQIEMFNLFLETWGEERKLDSDVWVGLYDLKPHKADDFVHAWTDDTALDTSLNWAGDEPNYKGKENCVRYTLSRNFRTKECSKLFATVCETETGCWFTEQKQHEVSGLHLYSNATQTVDMCKKTCLEMDSEGQLCVAVEHDGTVCRTYRGSYHYTATCTAHQLQTNPQSTVYLKRCYDGKLEDESAGELQSSQSSYQTTWSSTPNVDHSTTWSVGSGNIVFGGFTRTSGGTTATYVSTSDDMATSSDGMAASSDGMTTSSDGLATSSDGRATSSDEMKTSSYGMTSSSDGLAIEETTQTDSTPKGLATSFEGIATSSDGMVTSSRETATPAEGIATSSEERAACGETSVLTVMNPSQSTSTSTSTSDPGCETTSGRCVWVPSDGLPVEEVNKLIQSLVLERKTLSTYKRSKTSAKDDRSTAQAIGQTGLVLCVLGFVVVVLLDVGRLVNWLDMRRKRRLPFYTP